VLSRTERSPDGGGRPPAPFKSGALVLFVFVGNIAIKPATTAAVVLVATAAALRLHPDAGSPVSRRASPSP